MRHRIFLSIFNILILLWGIFILSKYFYLLVNLPWLSLDIKASYGLIKLAARGLFLPILFFILFNLIAIIVSRILRQSISKIIMAELLIATILLFFLSADHWLWLKALLFFGGILLMGFGTAFLNRSIFRISIPFWAGLLLSVVLIHYWNFIVGLIGAFRILAIMPFVFILCGIGCFELWKNCKDLLKKILFSVNNLHWPALLFFEGLCFVIAIGFVAACAPETRSDAIRSHVPFMINLVREGSLLPNYYWFGHLQSSPLQLVAAGGYLFLGEIGAKWFSWFMGVMAGVIIVAEIYHITKKWTPAFGTSFLFLSSPYIWIWLTTNYQDIPTVTFLIAGLAMFRRSFTPLESPVIYGVDDINKASNPYRKGGVKAPSFLTGFTERKDYLILSGILWGFAFVAKFHAFIVILAILIFFSIFFIQPTKLMIRTEFKKIILACLGFLLMVLPWLILVWYWTGNPIFPIANDSFKSPYLPPYFLEELKAGGKTLFRFPNGWFDIITWPWSMTFQTKYFGELPNGGAGPFFLILFPIIIGYIIYCLFKRYESNASKITMVMFFTGLSFIAFLSYQMEIPYVRFWNTGFSIIAISMGITFSEIIAMNQRYRNWVSIIFAIILVSLSMGILLGWGGRLNYGSPDGVGWALYTGKINRDEYLRKRTGNAYLYVNRNIKRGESIMAVGYEQLNTFTNFTFQLNIWNDKVIGLRKLEDYDHLIKKENVRYWVVQETYKKGYYVDMGIAQKYWQEERLVHSQNGFSVYTTKPSSEPKPKPLKEVRLEATKDAPSSLEGWRIAGYKVPPEEGKLKGRFDTQIYKDFYPPPQASKITGSIYFKSNQDNGVVLCDIVWYKSNREIKRSVGEAIAMKDKGNQLSFSESRPPEATKILLIIRPWRLEDGIITLEHADIKWWE